jgi:hypothetical protein
MKAINIEIMQKKKKDIDRGPKGRDHCSIFENRYYRSRLRLIHLYKFL